MAIVERDLGRDQGQQVIVEVNNQQFSKNNKNAT